ncbi:MAG: aspartate--ammonia ligase [Paludibacteraceae bacterium]|nr:aspartate--ammonia ligase [Paludibacteraceae bacterium]
MSKLVIPKNYHSLLDLRQTELAIKFFKDFFQTNLSAEMRLRRVTAPLFVLKGLGLNDDLNGVERPVSFGVKDMGDRTAEVVHSLAKWKRLTLAEYGIDEGYGLYTDMNAIRADEELDNIHSLYVDQWDWEMVISREQRNIEFLKEVVRRIYAVLVRSEYALYEMFPVLKPSLTRDIFFIHSEELLQMYPKLTPKERENKIVKEHGAVFVMGIGGQLSNGEKHDGRAPDYDDWTTPNSDGFLGLNGDILVWNEVLGEALELSSMGIRVDKTALLKQLEITGQQNRLQYYYHKRLVDGTLPLTLGGGIGQSRLCMYMLKKAHVGEIQASIWPEDMRQQCDKSGIHLL